MKRLALALCLLLAGPVRSEPLTLEEACRIALAKSPRMGVALSKMREALEDVETASTGQRLLGNLILLGPPLPGSLSERSEFVLSPARLELRKLIYDGGRLQAKIDSARATAGSKSEQVMAEWEELWLEIHTAYLQVLKARAVEGVAAQALELSQKNLEIAEARLRAGQVPKGEVLLARVPLADAETDLRKSKLAVQDGLDALCRLLGISMETALELVDPPAPAPLEGDLHAWEERGVEQRPDLGAGRRLVEAAERNVEAAERENHLQVGVVLGVAALAGPDRPFNDLSYRAGFEVTWPFMDGGRSLHLTGSAKEKLEQARLAQEDLTGQVRQEVRQAYRAVQLAEETERASEAQLTRAEDAMRIATAQFRVGFVAFPQVRQAQMDLTRAQVTRAASRYDTMTARAKLNYAAGVTPALKPNLAPTPQD